MKNALGILFFVLAENALAICPTPMITGNRYIDAQNQQAFYQCLSNQQQQLQQQPQYAPPVNTPGSINWGLIDPNTPARAANSYEEGRRQRLQNELLQLQIEQLKRQQGQ